MTSRPYDFVRRAPGVAAATFAARRLPTAGEPWQLDAEARLTSTWRPADFRGALEPLAVPPVPRLRAANAPWRTRSIATWETARYVGRLITFNLTVAILHLAMLWWLLLRIGG